MVPQNPCFFLIKSKKLETKEKRRDWTNIVVLIVVITVVVLGTDLDADPGN